MIKRTMYIEDGEVRFKYTYWPFALMSMVGLWFLFHTLGPDSKYTTKDCEIKNDNYSYTAVWCGDELLGPYRVCNYFEVDATRQDCVQYSWLKSSCLHEELTLSHMCTHFFSPIMSSSY